jgi:hypothetical protein
MPDTASGSRSLTWTAKATSNPSVDMKRRSAPCLSVFLAAALAACGGEKPLTTGLHITVTNVGWEKLEGDASSSVWQTVGARVDIDCGRREMVVSADHVERSSHRSVDELCSVIESNPHLLRSSPAPPCTEYNAGTVRVTGEWEGRRVRLKFPTCEGYAPGSERETDPCRQWAHLLGFYFQGPDAPG